MSHRPRPIRDTLTSDERLRQAAIRARQAERIKEVKPGLEGIGAKALALIAALLLAMGLIKDPREGKRIERVLSRAKNPHFLPRFLEAAKADRALEAQYWLRRSLGVKA